MPTAPCWRPPTRFLFRFALIYLLLYNLPFPLSYIPGLERVADWYQRAWNPVVVWTGAHVLHLSYPITVLPEGSGDTTWNYVQVMCNFAIALAGAIAWSLLDRRSVAYPRLFDWLRTYVRFSLGATMISYGVIKVIQLQFAAPGTDRMIQPLGEMSPMGLLWTFMGMSYGYNLFTGLGEMLGGLLLFFRRTALLGAVVSIGVLGHVFVLNMCYDVPVKLFSAHLLLMAMFVALPDGRRLANVLLLNRPTDAAPLRPLFQRAWLHRGAIVLRNLLILAFVGYSLYDANRQLKASDVRSPLAGVWEVQQFELDGQPRPPLVTDELRWQRVVITYPWSAAFQMMNGARRAYRTTLDPERRTIELGKWSEPNWKPVLTYDRPDDETLVLTGDLDGHHIRAVARRAPPPTFLLTSRGFHWVSEYPFNR